MRLVRRIDRKFREVRLFARAMQSASHPILAQIVPIRRCNLSCAYCNEYDRTSAPVPLATMLGRIDRLTALGTTIITISGGEPTLHPDLDAIIRRIRTGGAVATLITNGLLLTPDRIRALNRAGLDYLQISIDNVAPDDISKKSLRVLDLKLEWLARYAEFGITINSVLGAGVQNPEDAIVIGKRARQLGFTSTVGILHDHVGQLQPLAPNQRTVYDRFRHLGTALFSFAHFDQFQENIGQGLPNSWHCRAGGRFLYICEDGLRTTVRNSAAVPASRWPRIRWMISGGKRRGQRAARRSAPSRACTRQPCSTNSGKDPAKLSQDPRQAARAESAVRTTICCQGAFVAFPRPAPPRFFGGS